MSLLMRNTYATCIHKILSPNQNIMLEYFGACFPALTVNLLTDNVLAKEMDAAL